MGLLAVDQIGPSGELLADVDTKLSLVAKERLLLAALPGATVDRYAGERVVRFGDQVILKKQVTHLGYPWPAFKKRIQIPRKWLAVHEAAVADGLTPRFVGIYHYEDVTIFVDFDPSTYVRRKANNSAAHLATNDLFQAQRLGVFGRVDRNGNQLTSVRADLFADYLRGALQVENPYAEVFAKFNARFLAQPRIKALDAVKAMYAAKWPDAFQGEWPGFFLEFSFDEFTRRQGVHRRVAFQKVKQSGRYDFDLAFLDSGRIDFYGDLKASNIVKHESPGNDAEDLISCMQDFGRFWYVIYEHDTSHARDEDDLATIEWNEWKRSVGYQNKKGFDPLSYAKRFKSSVRFDRMVILEVNPANVDLVLREFAQGKQPDGAARALKVMINKRNIDNFLVYSEDAPTAVA